MLKTLSVLFLFLGTSYANDINDSVKPNILSIGVSTGAYGHGPYFRVYSDNSYYQINGFMNYEKEKIKETGVVKSSGIATIGVSYAYYIYDSNNEPIMIFPNSVNIKTGGNILVTEDEDEAVVAIGIGFEYKTPGLLGFTYEISIEYVGMYANDDISEKLYLGPRLSAQFGFNF